MIDDGTGADPSTARLGAVRRGARRGASPERDFAERSPDDLYIIYTGGTTGMPKGVVWRHEDIFFALGGGIDAFTNERVTDDAPAGREGRRQRDADDLPHASRR